MTSFLFRSSIFVIGIILSIVSKTFALETVPSSVQTVSNFYAWHFTHDMGFTIESLKEKQKWFEPKLYEILVKEALTESPPDEVPRVNGDPFTNSQEYPHAFRLGKITGNETQAIVEIIFSFVGEEKSMQTRLIQTNNTWFIYDFIYPSQESLREWLQSDGNKK